MGQQRRTMAFNAYNRNFDRPRFNPWQSGVMPNSGNGANVGNVGNVGPMGPVGPVGPVGPDATYALANNLLNMLQNRPNPMPSLLDINVRRDFGNNYGNNRFPPNKVISHLHQTLRKDALFQLHDVSLGPSHITLFSDVE